MINHKMIYLYPFYLWILALWFLHLLFIYHCCLHHRSKQKKLFFLIVNSLERTILVRTKKQEKSINHLERKLIVQKSIAHSILRIIFTSFIVWVGSTSTSLGAVSILSDISVFIAISIWPLNRISSTIFWHNP